MASKKKIILPILALSVMLLVTACQQTDIVGNKSVEALEQVLVTIPDNISKDDAINAWALTAPDGDARFIWSMDFSESPEFDAMLEADALPFLNAGLDPSRLPAGMLRDDRIVVGVKLSNEALSYNGEATPLASYEHILRTSPGRIGHHTALDHFGIDLDNGNMFEWARDMADNDKDIVFVLEPDVFINAGVDPDQVDGWLFAKVETMDEKGNSIEVDKLLKPFELA